MTPRGTGPIDRPKAWVMLAALACLNLFYAGALIATAYVLALPQVVSPDALPAPDFVAFWAAGKLAAAGTPELAYDVALHRQVEVAGLGRDFANFMPWHYPPPFQLLVTPFAALPFWVAMALWCGLTLALFLWVAWRILPDPMTIAGVLAAVPTAIILVNGQTGFLVAALLGAGLLTAGRRPALAGALIGLISVKPQLGLALPVALIAAGRWRMFWAAAATVAGLGLVSWALLGAETWRAFADSLGMTGGAFRSDDPRAGRWEMFASLYGYGRFLGLGYGPGLALQGAVSLAALSVTALAWRREDLDFEIKAALLCFATAATTPRILNYDLHVLVVGVLFQLRHARAAGFFPGEQLLVAGAALAAFLSVLFSPGVLPLLAPALMAALWAGRLRQAPARG